MKTKTSKLTSMHSSRMRTSRLLIICLLGGGVHPSWGLPPSWGLHPSCGGTSIWVASGGGGGVHPFGLHPRMVQSIWVAFWMHPPVDRMTDACENITFRKLRLQAVKNTWSQRTDHHSIIITITLKCQLWLGDTEKLSIAFSHAWLVLV